VEGDTERKFVEPSLTELRKHFRNRRVVVRGQPRLQAVWVGGRIDRRRKQVTLVVEDAKDIALLPRYNDDGEPVFDGMADE